MILLNEVEKMESNLSLSHTYDTDTCTSTYRGVGRIKKLVRVSKQESKKHTLPKSTEVTCTHVPNVISEAKTDISTEGQGCAVC